MTSGLDVDAGLKRRLQSAGAMIVWSDAAPAEPGGRPGRRALLHDESARVETWGSDEEHGLMVTSGPVGALVLLLEVDRRGTPASLGARDGGREPGFPEGAIVATWGSAGQPVDSRPSLHELIELARYALP